MAEWKFRLRLNRGKTIIEPNRESLAKDWGDAWETEARGAGGEFESGGHGGGARIETAPKGEGVGSGGPKEATWGNWSRADPNAVRQGKVDEFRTEILKANAGRIGEGRMQVSQDNIDRSIQRQVNMLKPTTDWKLPNGTVVSITNGIRSTPEQQKQLMDAVERITAKYPPGDKPLTFNILGSAEATNIMGTRSLGGTTSGGTQVWISPKVFNVDKAQSEFEAASGRGFYSPASKGANVVDYVVTHEFGHTLDTQPRSDAVRAAIYPASRSDYTPATSRYGQSNTDERYAEAFAEHELSGGTTTQPLAQKLAVAAGWK